MKNFSLFSSRFAFGFLLLLLIPLTSQAQTIGPNRVLIRNAVLFDPSGVVVKNRLFGVVADEPEEEPQKAGWLAYTPPPFMVPLNYTDASRWNQFESRYINGVFVSAVVLDRMNWLSQDAG